MKIRLTELCEFGEAGDVLEPDMPDIANLLIQRGVAACVENSVPPNPPRDERPTRRRKSQVTSDK